MGNDQDDDEEEWGSGSVSGRGQMRPRKVKNPLPGLTADLGPKGLAPISSRSQPRSAPGTRPRRPNRNRGFSSNYAVLRHLTLLAEYDSARYSEVGSRDYENPRKDTILNQSIRRPFRPDVPDPRGQQPLRSHRLSASRPFCRYLRCF